MANAVHTDYGQLVACLCLTATTLINMKKRWEMQTLRARWL